MTFLDHRSAGEGSVHSVSQSLDFVPLTTMEMAPTGSSINELHCMFRLRVTGFPVDDV